MAVLDMFRNARQRAEIAPSSLPNAMATTGIVTPFSDGQLQKFVWNDIFGTDSVPVTRIEAMSVPSIVGGRGLLLGALAGRPLRELQGRELAKPQPSWLYRTNTDVSLWHRMAHTFDDWIFYGVFFVGCRARCSRPNHGRRPNTARPMEYKHGEPHSGGRHASR